MYPLFLVQWLLKRVKRNLKRIIRHEKRLFQSICDGTHRNEYLRRFRIRRYKTYRTLSTFQLNVLVKDKKINYSTNSSSVFTGIFWGATVGALFSNIKNIAEFLTTSASSTPELNWASILIIGFALLVLLTPLIMGTVALFIGISMVRIWCFFLLLFITTSLLPFAEVVPELSWIPLTLIILLLVNLYTIIIITTELIEQRKLIECEVIQEILDKRDLAKLNNQINLKYS